MAAPKDFTPDGSAAAEPVEAAAVAEPAPASAVGLVEIYDGGYALVVSVDPPLIVRLGQPELHELPVRPVS